MEEAPNVEHDISPQETCRICRGEGSSDEPLYHPCKCSGSIKYVHQDCLLEWLKHSKKSAVCELCNTAYKFTKRKC
jgi:E3 ubiquitin-protein ligase MARCH6